MPMQRNLELDAALSAIEYPLRGSERSYFRYHAQRYRELVCTLRSLLGDVIPSPRILVVGPGYEVRLLQHLLDARIDTIGLGAHAMDDVERHVEFDLRDIGRGSTLPPLREYDAIVVAEVIEHLPLPPEAVLGPLAELLAPGGVLLVQTPNAARLDNRWKLMRGRNPFERMRGDASNPGHMREYTAPELSEIGRAAGLIPLVTTHHNYFGSGGAHPHLHALYERWERVVPSRLREGITIVYIRA